MPDSESRSQARRLTDTYRRNLATFARAAAELPEGAEHERIGGASSLNWVTGHVLGSRLLVLGFLNTRQPGVDAEAVRARYGKDTQPDPDNALPLTELLEHLGATQDTLAAALNATDLTPTVQSPFGEMTLGELVDFFGWHEGYHAGQAAMLRRQLIRT